MSAYDPAQDPHVKMLAYLEPRLLGLPPDQHQAVIEAYVSGLGLNLRAQHQLIRWYLKR